MARLNEATKEHLRGAMFAISDAQIAFNKDDPVRMERKLKEALGIARSVLPDFRNHHRGHRKTNRLHPKQLATLPVGIHVDGNGLMFRVTETRRTFVVRMMIEGRSRQRTIGPWPETTLTAARKRNVEIHGSVRRGENPFTATTPTFAQMADMLREDKAWSESTANTFRRLVDTHALPRIKVTVDKVAAHHVKDALASATAPTTKIAVCRAISQVLQKAIDEGYRTTLNPCPPMISDLERKHERQHHRSLGSVDVAPKAIKAVWNHEGTTENTKRLLLFALGTGSRFSQAAMTTWAEIQGGRGDWVWHVPKSHMKDGMVPVGEEWRIPLPDALVELIGLDKPGRRDGLIFHTPKSKTGQVASGTLRYALRAAGVDSTTHGWRATFGDWCRKEGIDPEVRELCQGRRPTRSAVANAYTGTDRYEERKDALERWVEFILP